MKKILSVLSIICKYFNLNTFGEINRIPVETSRVVFTLITFCIIWKDTIFSVISILNFLKSTSRQIFTKTKRLNGSKTIVFDFNIIFVFINVWLPMLLKKFNMDITEKMVSFQIIQNVLKVKCTQAVNCYQNWQKLFFIRNPEFWF